MCNVMIFNANKEVYISRMSWLMHDECMIFILTLNIYKVFYGKYGFFMLMDQSWICQVSQIARLIILATYHQLISWIWICVHWYSAQFTVYH